MLSWFSSPGGPTLAELLRQGLSSIEGGYDRLAAKFDRSVFRTPDVILEQLADAIPEGERALDIGCGTGAVLERLARRCAQVEGIDLSRAMLQKAGEAVPAARLWHGDFLHTSWENAFDVIASVGVMGHIDPADQREFFRRVHAALKPGGCYLTVIGDLRRRTWLWLPAYLFDLGMRVRNTFWRPRFIMYYLSFVLPQARDVVERAGLRVELLRGNFPEPYSQLQILRAIKPSETEAGGGAAGADARPSELPRRD